MPEKRHQPKFSVIMPVYDHAEYVGEAIESVRAQTFGDWELIVIDDGSSDGSGEIAEEFAARDRRIRVLHQVNAGPAAARNAGIRAAQGEWLAYLDSDDLWYPQTLANYGDAIAARPAALFFYGYRHRLNPDGSLTELPGEFQQHATGTREIFQRMYLSHMCVCYRRGLMDRAGPYDESLRSCEDYELYLRMSLHTTFEPLGRATGLRRRHGRNISRRSGFSRFQEAEVLRRFVEKQGGRQVLPQELISARLGRLYLAAGREYLRGGCFRQAGTALKQSGRWRRSSGAVVLRIAARLLRPFSSKRSADVPWMQGPE